MGEVVGIYVTEGPVIGCTVRLPNGVQGTVISASASLLRARLFNQVYYKVQWNDHDRRKRWYPFSDMTVEGRGSGEMVV